MKHWHREKTHLWVLSRGEKLIESLTAALEANSLRGGMISGLGALTQVELGYYELERKEYLRERFDDDYELISLTGNISLKDQKPFIHVHAALGDRGFKVFGGHLFEATVAVTVEITVVPFEFVPQRQYDAAMGLGLICELAS